jgi:predicted outer membrane repeat protein
MQRRSQGPSTLPKMVIDCGAPSLIKSDNAPEFKGKTWVNYLRKHQIPFQFTEAFHLNENYCEHRGGAIKTAVIHILMTTNAELEFWCYCLELVFLLQSVLARCSLSCRTSQELHFGETPDISMFWFVFWCLSGTMHLDCLFQSQRCFQDDTLGLPKTLEMHFASLF